MLNSNLPNFFTKLSEGEWRQLRAYNRHHVGINHVG